MRKMYKVEQAWEGRIRGRTTYEIFAESGQEALDTYEQGMAKKEIVRDDRENVGPPLLIE